MSGASAGKPTVGLESTRGFFLHVPCVSPEPAQRRASLTLSTGAHLCYSLSDLGPHSTVADSENQHVRRAGHEAGGSCVAFSAQPRKAPDITSTICYWLYVSHCGQLRP